MLEAKDFKKNDMNEKSAKADTGTTIAVESCLCKFSAVTR